MNSSPSLERVCLDVKLPNVVCKQRSKAFKVVFIRLYQQSDKQGFIELDASRLSQMTGISRRQIYRAINFLQRVNLLFLKIARTGRGQHSLFKLNWKKSVPSPIPPIKTKTKNLLRDQKSMQKSAWNQKVKAFRELLSYSFLDPDEQRICCSVVGMRLKKWSRKEALQVYRRIVDEIHKLAAPNWVHTKQQLCAWFGSILKRFYVDLQVG